MLLERVDTYPYGIYSVPTWVYPILPFHLLVLTTFVEVFLAL